MIAEGSRPDLSAYRRFVAAFSGGKDSLAAMLRLLSLGVPPHAIRLHHHPWTLPAGAIGDHAGPP